MHYWCLIQSHVDFLFLCVFWLLRPVPALTWTVTVRLFTVITAATMGTAPQDPFFSAMSSNVFVSCTFPQRRRQMGIEKYGTSIPEAAKGIAHPPVEWQRTENLITFLRSLTKAASELLLDLGWCVPDATWSLNMKWQQKNCCPLLVSFKEAWFVIGDSSKPFFFFGILYDTLLSSIPIPLLFFKALLCGKRLSHLGKGMMQVTCWKVELHFNLSILYYFHDL